MSPQHTCCMFVVCICMAAHSSHCLCVHAISIYGVCGTDKGHNTFEPLTSPTNLYKELSPCLISDMYVLSLERLSTQCIALHVDNSGISSFFYSGRMTFSHCTHTAHCPLQSAVLTKVLGPQRLCGTLLLKYCNNMRDYSVHCRRLVKQLHTMNTNSS